MSLASHIAPTGDLCGKHPDDIDSPAGCGMMGTRVMIETSLRVERALIVEDDELFRRSLVRFCRPLAKDLVEAATVAEARVALAKRPTLVLLDVRLPDGSGLEVVELANDLRPAPLIVAFSGEATPPESFRLAQLGVREFLQKPFDLEQLEGALARSQEAPPALQPLVAGAVGHIDLGDVKAQVRQTMVRQALAMTKGNRSAAARLLGVSRQALQHIVRHDETVDASADEVE